MPQHLRPTLTVAALAAVPLVLAPATAGAQVPGEDESTQVVVVDSSDLRVTVDDHAADSPAVTGSVQNNTDHALTCAGPKGKDSYAGETTEAGIVAEAMRYYTTYPWTAAPSINASVTIMGNYPIDLGSVETYIPAAIAGSIRPDLGARRSIADKYTAARLAGKVGRTATFSVPAHTSQTFTSTLGDPSAGARPDFVAGAFFVCTDETGQAYAFAGYEGGAAPAEGTGSLGSASLPTGSLPTGSLPSGSTGSR